LYTLVILVLSRLRQEDPKFEASLGYMVKAWSQKIKGSKLVQSFKKTKELGV
jgi:hypothetical protein